MGETIAAVLIAAIFLAIMIWMAASWRRRVRHDSALVPEPLAPAARGESLCLLEEGMYVATTEHGEPLERLAIGALTYPGRARIEVTSTGVGIRIAGEDEIFLRADRLLGAGRATWTIDRAVEKDGLIFVTWQPDAHGPADSYLRVVDPGDGDRIVDAITTIAAGSSPMASNEQ